MDVLQMVPLWIFNFFPDNVWKYDFSNLAGWKRCGKLKRSGKTVLDDQSSMELGIFQRISLHGLRSLVLDFIV